MFLKVHPENPQERNIEIVSECLLAGGIIIYPTDTIYGLGCDIFQHKAIERICRIKQIDPSKAQLSFVCYDLSDLSVYTKSISTPLYRILKIISLAHILLFFQQAGRFLKFSKAEKIVLVCGFRIT